MSYGKASNLQRRFLKKKFRICRGKLVEIYDYRKLMKYMIMRQIQTKQKKSLRILKIALGGMISEQMDDCERKVKEIFMDKIELENDIIIERAHRSKKSKYGKKDQPRTMVCKLLSYKVKVKVLQNCKRLKGSHIYINEDQPTLQYRKELWKEVKPLREEEVRLLIFSIVHM